MGFSEGLLLSGKAVVGPEPTPGWVEFEGQKVALEGHSLQYTVVSQLDTAYKDTLARHVFNRDPIAQGNFDFISQRHARYVAKTLLDVGVHVTGSTEFPVPTGLEGKLPAVIDFVLEQPYEAKKICSESRLAKSKALFDGKDPPSAATLPDCVTRHVAGNLLSKWGIVTTVPGAEFDGTCAGRLLTGWRVLCYSGGSDLMMWPMGRFTGVLYYVQRARSKGGQRMVRKITWQRKAKIMEVVLMMSTGYLQVADPKALVYVEMVYLALACTSGHDYNFVKVVNGDGSNTYRDSGDPRVTPKPFRSLLALLQARLKELLGPRKLPNILKMAPDKMMESATKLVLTLLVQVDAKFIAKKGALEGAIAGFMKHPVSLTHENFTPLRYDNLLAQYLQLASKRRSARGAGHALAEFTPTGWGGAAGPGGAAVPAIESYDYRGGCGGCGFGKGEEKWKLPTSHASVKWQTAATGGQFPMYLLSFVINFVSLVSNRKEVEWPIFNTFNPTDYVLALMDRAASIDGRSLRVAIPPVELVPESIQPDPSKAECIVLMQACVPQSFGCAKKEKADRMDGATYITTTACRMSTSSGQCLEVVGMDCGCDSVILCRHIIGMLVFASRLAFEHYNTSTTTGKYWAGVAAKRKLASGKPWRIGDAVVQHKFLSDTHGGALSDKDLVKVTGDPNTSITTSKARVNRKRPPIAEGARINARKVTRLEKIYDELKDVERMKAEGDASEPGQPLLTRRADFEPASTAADA